jgi:hypothetical protein
MFTVNSVLELFLLALQAVSDVLYNSRIDVSGASYSSAGILVTNMNTRVSQTMRGLNRPRISLKSIDGMALKIAVERKSCLRHFFKFI